MEGAILEVSLYPCEMVIDAKELEACESTSF